MKFGVLIVFLATLALIYAQLFAWWDVLARQNELSFFTRVAWLVAMFMFPVVGTIAYLRMGPGAAHWPPWDSSEE